MKAYQGKKADHCDTIRMDGTSEQILFNDAHCFAAQHVYLAGLGATDAECTGGKLIMIRGGVGMHQNMQPDAMRSLAATLIMMADMADANSARMASAVIAAAAKPRP